jgi:hypothetical protein
MEIHKFFFSWRYCLIISPKTFSGIISLCWLFGSLIGFLPVFGWHNDGYQGVCLFTAIMDYNYLVFLYFATIITPSLILAVFYGLIYRVILRQVSYCESLHMGAMWLKNRFKVENVQMEMFITLYGSFDIHFFFYSKGQQNFIINKSTAVDQEQHDKLHLSSTNQRDTNATTSQFRSSET